MYITTFYSFKGGVGRTMALVNTAVTLALRGRRVLVVDFDVEAPGLDTFDVLRTREEVPGVIDFVTRYLESGQAPDAADYIGECSDIGEEGGQLWIMPSGRSDSYAANFNQVDWAELYDRRDGYLLFEDLKEQWNQVLRPDYVLIDSRTGHTDTCGICTRQLPDSVVVLFFPNEQNLRGLSEVVGDIRSEAKEPRNKTIELHFVMSNVPDLDDEDQILETKIDAFQRQLGFRREPMVVHRYDSLSLLNQVVFSKDRPRSRLAKEYGDIVQEIAARNWQDRDGALEYIRRAGRRWELIEDDSTTARERMLEKIEDAHAEDGEVLFRLAELREDDRQPESAALLIQQAIDAGYDQPEAYLKRARTRADNDDASGANEDAWRVLESSQVPPPMVREALGRLLRTESSNLKDLAESTAVTSLKFDDQSWLAHSFNRTHEHLRLAVSLWERLLAEPDCPEERIGTAQHFLGVSYMGLGNCSAAAGMFRKHDQNLAALSIADAFNYAMAVWGMTQTVESEAFQHVVDLDLLDVQADKTANYLQCMAVSYWATGEKDAALGYVDRAQATLSALRGRTEFSCWRYLQVGAGSFEADLDDIRALIEDGRSPLPRFMAATLPDSRQSRQGGQQT